MLKQHTLHSCPSYVKYLKGRAHGQAPNFDTNTMFMTVVVPLNEAVNEVDRLHVDGVHIDPGPSVRDIIFSGQATLHSVSTVVRTFQRDVLVYTFK